MHQIGVVLAGKDVTGAAHIRGELINFIKSAVDDSAAEAGIPQIANDEIIGFELIDVDDAEIVALARDYARDNDLAFPDDIRAAAARNPAA